MIKIKTDDKLILSCDVMHLHHVRMRHQLLQFNNTQSDMVHEYDKVDDQLIPGCDVMHLHQDHHVTTRHQLLQFSNTQPDT
jgi:hypothetical protein